MLWSIWSPWRNEKGATAVKQNGATATYPKMMPRQHIRKWCHDNISVPVAHGDTGAKGSVTWAGHARWWGDPVFRVPTGRWHGKRGASQGQFDHGAKLEHLIQPSMHSITVGHLGRYTFEASVSGGTSSSREVVVHVRPGEVLDESNIFEGRQ